MAIRRDSGLVRALRTSLLRTRTNIARDQAVDDDFSPDQVAGLKLWFDAGAGVFTDADATTPATADDDAVGAWLDKSTNGRLFVQATTDSQPVLKTGANGINGHPVVRGDGVADHLKIASAVLSSSSGSVFAVFRLTDPVIDVQTIIASADEASTSRQWLLRALHTILLPHLGTTQRNADTADTIYGSTTLVAGTAYLASIESTGTAYGMRANGAAQTLTVASGADNGDWTADTPARDNTVLFASQNSGGVASYLKGDIAELLVYEPQISAGHRTQIEQYLAIKYGVTLA